jgi:chromosome segregation ATPase
MTEKITKAPRGVQQEDVWGAADAVLSQGERPTIERVRQQLGRGSPNTVAPLLESWFATLGQRLNMSPDPGHSDSGLPAPVQRAATVLWQRAQQIAQTQAQDSVATERNELSEMVQALARERDVFSTEQRVMNERCEAANRTLALAQAQASQWVQQLEEAKRLLIIKEQEMTELREQQQGLQHMLDMERQRFQAQVDAAQQERQRLEDRSAANERRLLVELDATRSEVKRHKVALLDEVEKAARQAQQHQATEFDLALKLKTLTAENNLLKQHLDARTASLNSLQQSIQEQSRSSHQPDAGLRTRLAMKRRSQRL